MPYIDEVQRRRIISPTMVINFEEVRTAGDLNYLMTMGIVQYLKGGLNYQAINNVRGVMADVHSHFGEFASKPAERALPAVTMTKLGEIKSTLDLYYFLWRAVAEYIRHHSEEGGRALPVATIDDIRGALHNCYFEFYRRVAGPYEDKKIRANGDVYGEILKFI